MSVLALDAGTTGVTALAVEVDGSVSARGYREFPQHFPRPGWVEHDPEEIWTALLAAAGEAVAGAASPPVAIGVTGQRETVVLWRRADLSAPRPAIVWQDRRTAELCADLRAAGSEPLVTATTGLRLDPYFSGTKLSWLARHEPDIWAGVRSGDTAIGTIDAYVIARLTAGARHVTDPSHASRTLLFDIRRGAWSSDMCDLFEVPMAALPTVVDSSGHCGTTDPGAFLGLELPVAGIAGDQQSALFGQACFRPGESKCTYGTGSFLLVNTGATPRTSGAGLLTTVAWRIGGVTTYALEGAIFVTGAAVQWLRDGLGLIPTSPSVEELAASVPDTGGVVFVPALTGLGAPDWDPTARGTILGLTRGTSAGHLARATLEAIAFEVRDVADVLPVPVTALTVDGGAAANDLLCQLQADQLGVPVRRPRVLETTGLGAAFLAGLAMQVWPDLEALRATWTLDREFRADAGARDDGRHARWREGVRRSKGWA
ncbi:MAG TPA: glycerol kinase [Mycobacteriales bacterium]|nr:glycerol kinase [Mycobacteriales bacterium]